MYLLGFLIFYARKVGICENQCCKIKTMQQNTLKRSRASKENSNRKHLFYTTEGQKLKSVLQLQFRGLKAQIQLQNPKSFFRFTSGSILPHLSLLFSTLSHRNLPQQRYHSPQDAAALTDKISGNSVLCMGFNIAEHSTMSKALSTKNKNVS